MIEQINHMAGLWWSWMWPMFWQSGLLIILVFVFDLLIGRRVWPQVRYALWLLVLVKLILPPTFASPTSLTSHILSRIENTAMKQGFSPSLPVSNAESEIFTPVVEKNYSENTAKGAAIANADTALSEKIETSRASMKLSAKGYIFIIWLLVAAGLTFLLLSGLKRIRKNTTTSSLCGQLPEWFTTLMVETAETLNMRTFPRVVLSQNVSMPAVFGAWRPVLIVPADEISKISKTNARHFLLHEFAHIKRGDLIILSVDAVLQIIYWFNPLVWLARMHIKNLRELCCDNTVAGILKENAVQYRQTLLETARRLLTKAPVPALGLLGLFENHSWLVDRLRWLEKENWKHRRLSVLAATAVIAVMSIFVLPMAGQTGTEQVSQNPVGRWESVDFVSSISDFKPGQKKWQHELFVREVEFRANGKIDPFPAFSWNDGWILDNVSKVKAQFYIRQINDSTYMFFPWLSGDVTSGGQKPWYYVLRKVSVSEKPEASSQEFRRSSISDINAKVEQLNIDSASLDDVIRIFGQPREYRWGQQTFTKNKLPSNYVAVYPDGFSVYISGGQIIELRFEHIDMGYVFAGKIRIGTSLDESLEVLGRPEKIVEGDKNGFQDCVLYKDIEGRKGFCYYGRKDKGIRLFFADYKVTALYVTRHHYDAGDRGGAFHKVTPISSVKEFDDVRDKDLSGINPAEVAKVIATLKFNKDTIWPKQNLPPAKRPEKLLKDAMNPGLGIRYLHKQGITGKGVNVAIIDQPLYQDHPEFAGKIVGYFDTGCNSESSMHGPSVASLLVGTNCGTAPDSRVFYAAAPSWLKDSAYYAGALDWIIEQNAGLPDDRKIRVVSVSAAPSGPGSPFEKNQQMWDNACSRAEAAGILVLDCTSHHGFIRRCFFDAIGRENPSRCSSDIRQGQKFDSKNNILFAPSGPRTMAEEYQKGRFTYQYNARGGLSWAIPYVAGVLAMGWQVNPQLGPGQMKEMLFKSAATGRNSEKIINPRRFIAMVKMAKPDTAGPALRREPPQSPDQTSDPGRQRRSGR